MSVMEMEPPATEPAPPALLGGQLYVSGSLRNAGEGVELALVNRLGDAELTGVSAVRIDGTDVPLSAVRVIPEGAEAWSAEWVSEASPLPLVRDHTVRLEVARDPLPAGSHRVEVEFACTPFGALRLDVSDEVAPPGPPQRLRIPRSRGDDYTEDAAAGRRAFAERFAGCTLNHVAHYAFDPHAARGNCEHFTGVAAVPLGLAGPLRVNGEHARGDFLIPLATSEGTLVASYNRGMQALNESGGAKATVVADAMQRAPVFVFDDARQGRDFVAWIGESFAKIASVAESTSSVAKLVDVDHCVASKFVYLRFNYRTGDAAGQNMVSRATYAVCGWILDHYPGVRRFYLESNFATDKKASHVNLMRTRGKRVTAECTIPREVLVRRLRVEPEALAYHFGVASVGSILSGANNNGLHSANAITAMFIATGQDVANVAEASAGVIYTEVTPEKDLYLSVTIPSLIVATHGGGTGLPTQRECLELLGCTGQGSVNKLAEIVAGVVLAGELSLACAISSLEWVSSHERYGRHR